MQAFKDRQEAGAVLARHLSNYAAKPKTIILALPRGGVPVAFEVAKRLSLPLDVFIVRKLGLPGHEELAMGALASGNTFYFNQDIVNSLSIPKATIDKVINAEQKELERREQLYRGTRPFPELKDWTIILIDDGIATGATMRAAIKSLYKHQPSQIIVAVPVAALSTCNEMAGLVDALICPLKPIDFNSVGLWYQDFTQTTDAEVIDLLKKATV